MAVRKRAVLELAHPNAAGLISVGESLAWRCLRTGTTSRGEFKSFTDDLERLADWLGRLRDRHTVAGRIDRHLLGYRLSNPNAGFHGLSGQCPAREECLGPQIRRARLPMAATIDELRLFLGRLPPKDEICALRAKVAARDMLLSLRRGMPNEKRLAQMNVQLQRISGHRRRRTGRDRRAIIAGRTSRAARLAQMKNVRIRASEAEIAKSLRGNWREEHLFAFAAGDGPVRRLRGALLAECDQQLEALLAACSPKRPVIRQESTPLAGRGMPRRCPGLSVRDVASI